MEIGSSDFLQVSHIMKAIGHDQWGRCLWDSANGKLNGLLANSPADLECRIPR